MLPKLSFKNSQSPFLPDIEIEVLQEQLGKELTAGLHDIILKEERNILTNLTSPNPNDPDQTWLTGRLWQYNFLDFDYPETKELAKLIKEYYVKYAMGKGVEPETVYVQCWANIVRNHRTITRHNHATAHTNLPPVFSYVSGNICIAAEQTSTYYQNPFLEQHAIGVPNVPGTVFLFPSYVNHWVDKNKSPNPRLSIAFDIIPESTYKLGKDVANFRKL